MRDGSFLIALPYGDNTDWLRNVLAKGSATLMIGGKTYQVDRPAVRSHRPAGGPPAKSARRWVDVSRA